MKAVVHVIKGVISMQVVVNAGKPEPLVFHVPQAFFDALQQRISMGSKKKRLPNSTTGNAKCSIMH